jgi:hypothetical protein
MEKSISHLTLFAICKKHGFAYHRVRRNIELLISNLDTVTQDSRLMIEDNAKNIKLLKAANAPRFYKDLRANANG